MESLVHADLVGSQGAAALKHEDDLPEFLRDAPPPRRHRPARPSHNNVRRIAARPLQLTCERDVDVHYLSHDCSPALVKRGLQWAVQPPSTGSAMPVIERAA